MALPVLPRVMGGFRRWRGKAAGAGGWLNRGCRALIAAAKIVPAARGLHKGVGFGYLQRTALAGVAWQLLVWCRTSSEDGARSNDTMGRLGLQRTAAGCSALLGNSGVVHRQKTAQTTTWLAGMMAEGVCAGGATRCCRPVGVARLFLTGFLEMLQYCSSS